MGLCRKGGEQETRRARTPGEKCSQESGGEEEKALSIRERNEGRI